MNWRQTIDRDLQMVNRRWSDALKVAANQAHFDCLMRRTTWKQLGLGLGYCNFEVCVCSWIVSCVYRIRAPVCVRTACVGWYIRECVDVDV